MALASLAVASCGGGDDEAAAAGGGGGGANNVPTISGTPGTSAVQGAAYAFLPAASDADSDTLTFTIQNKPGWATFTASTGRLAGTPGMADIGQTTSNIVISVSDGRGGSASLAAFNLTVTAIGTRSVTLSWQPPTQNTDGSPLTDLAGYRIYYGTTAGGPYSTSVTITNPGIATYFIDNLAPNTYYFVATAFDASGNESSFSGQASRAL